MPSHASSVAEGPVDIILRDGTTLRLRAPESADLGALVDFFAGLSKRSLYQRFHGFRHAERELVQPFLDPDWVERGALIGTLADGDAERIVALANYVRLRNPAAAEAAFVVADELQGRGLVRGFRGAPPADDAALVDLVHRLARLAEDFPEVAELDLNPVLALKTGYVAVDARIRLCARRPTQALKSW